MANMVLDRKNLKTLATKVDREVHDEIARRAAADDRTIGQYVRKMLMETLKRELSEPVHQP